MKCIIIGLLVQCLGSSPSDPEEAAKILLDRLNRDTRVTDELDKRILDREPLVNIVPDVGWIDKTTNPGPSPYRLDGSLKSDPLWTMQTPLPLFSIIIVER